MTAHQDAAAPKDISEALANLGTRYDVTGVFPVESLARLRSAGLHRRFAPVAAGGDRFLNAGARYTAMRRALGEVGRGDLSVGRLFEGHLNALLLFDWYGRRKQLAWLSEVLDHGGWFGVWATEPAPGVRLVNGVLHGAKSFASGAGGLAFALVTTAAEGEDRRLIIAPADDPARTNLTAWCVRGMRASVSGRYDLSGLRPRASDLLGEPGDYDREPRFTAGAWRFCAVQLGGAEALLAETRVAMSDDARADPVRRARFADAVAAVRTADLWVAEAARRAAAEDADAPAIVDMTRGVVERAAFDVIEASARLVGTRSAFTGERIDKISRDLSLYLRQGGPDLARDRAAKAFLARDVWSDGALW